MPCSSKEECKGSLGSARASVMRLVLAAAFLSFPAQAIRLQELEVSLEGDDPLDSDVVEGPALLKYMTRLFHVGESGLEMEAETGKVTAVSGQAAEKGVQIGWHVFEMGDLYPWSIYRWNNLHWPRSYNLTFTTAPTLFACQNMGAGWKDSKDRDCNAYQENNLCTATGAATSNLKKCILGWCNTMDKFRRDGLNAATACCTCGGGWDVRGVNKKKDATTTTTTTSTLAKVPKDPDEIDPALPPAGAPAVPAPAPAPPVTTTATSTHGEHAVCRDSPHDWKDRLGYGCSQYENQYWCENPDLDVVAYRNSKGLSAKDACCACGGGGWWESHGYKQAEKMDPQRSGAAVTSTHWVFLAFLAVGVQ